MQRYFCCLAFLFFLVAAAWSQDRQDIEHLYAAVVGPSPVTLNSTALAIGGKTLDASQPNLVKILRQYIDRKLSFPGGLYVSPTDSVNWKIASWPNLTLRAMALSTASGQPKLLLGADNGVLRAFANSTGWQIITDWQITEITDIERDPFSDQALYLCSANGILISWDGGTTWQQSNDGLDKVFVNCLCPDLKVNGRWLAGTENGLYQSQDGGRHWQALALSGIPVYAILREPESWPGIFWIGTAQHGLYESVDGGKTFAPVPIGEDGVTIYTLAGGGSTRPIYAGAHQRGIFFASSVGQNWQQMLGSERLGSVTSIVPLPDRNLLYAGTYDRGVLVSRNGGETWQALGLVGAHVRQLMIGESSWLRPEGSIRNTDGQSVND